MPNNYSLDLELSSSQYASIADASQTGLDITGDITLELWFRPEQIGITQVLVAKDDFAGTNKSYDMFVGADNVLNFVYSADGNSTGQRSVFTTDAFLEAGDVGNWVHIAASITVASGTGAMYKNGVSKTTSSSGTDTAIFNSAAAFSIGCNFNSGTPANFADGMVDEVRAWSVARTATEVAAYYNKIIPPQTNLKGYWRLENNYLDTSGNGNTLTGGGSPSFSTTVQPLSDMGNFFLMF